MIQDIVNGLTQFFNNFAFTILSFIGNIIGFIANLILTPLNLLFDIFFPDFTNVINSFKDFIIYLSTMPLEFFVSLVPPITRSMILFYLTLKIAYFTLIYSYKAIVVVPNLIRRIKFW